MYMTTWIEENPLIVHRLLWGSPSLNRKKAVNTSLFSFLIRLMMLTQLALELISYNTSYLSCMGSPNWYPSCDHPISSKK